MDIRSGYNIIDLSVPIDEKKWEPSPLKKEIVDHKTGANILGEAFGLDYRDFPDNKGITLYTYQITTHTGTHLDAPFHFGDINQDGNKARTITEVPLEWCFGNGVLLDLECPEADEPVSKEEILLHLEKINYQIQPFDIVLLKTGGDKYIGKPEYFTSFRGVSPEATEYLIDCGVKIMGVDSFGFDAPFKKMAEKYLKDKNQAHLWPSHVLGRRKEYCHIERLTNLDKLQKPVGFKVCCFPIKLTDSDAAWCRVVALENRE